MTQGIITALIFTTGVFALLALHLHIKIIDLKFELSYLEIKNKYLKKQIDAININKIIKGSCND